MDDLSFDAAAAKWKHLREMPTDTLPVQCQRFIKTVADATGAPPQFVLAGVLAQGSMMARNLKIEVKPGYFEFSSIYIGIIGKPGTAKTPAIMSAIGPTMRQMRTQFEAFRARLEDWETRLAQAGEKEARVLRRQKPECPGFLIQSGGTSEGMMKQLELLHRAGDAPQLMAYHDELISLIGDMDAYRGGKGSDQQKWLQLYQGSNSPIILKSQDPVFIPDARVTLVGGIQPAVLADKMPDGEDGLLDRFIFLYCDEQPKQTDIYVSMDMEIVAAYDDVMEVVETPQTIGLDAEAREEFQKFYAWSKEKGSEHHTGAFKKWDRSLAKIALILAAIHGSRIVDGNLARMAVKLSQYLAIQWLGAMAIKDSGRDPDLRKYILAKILSSKKAITSRDLFKILKIKKNLDESKEIVKDLLDEKIIELIPEGKSKIFQRFGAFDAKIKK